MEVMRTVYAKKRDSVSTHLKQNMTQTITEHTRVMCKESAHHLRRKIYFAELFDVTLWYRCFQNVSFVSLFFLVGVQIFVRKFPIHLHTVYASPQKLARLLMIRMTDTRIKYVEMDKRNSLANNTSSCFFLALPLSYTFLLMLYSLQLLFFFFSSSCIGVELGQCHHCSGLVICASHCCPGLASLRLHPTHRWTAI